MRKFYSIPPFFLVLAASIGLFLRWQFVDPTPGIRYTYFLHAHSHLMFLGWVFNVLFLAFVDHHLSGLKIKPFIRLFLFLQALTLAMTISFPLQGYGTFSIIFTTVHTLAVMGFIIFFFKRTNGKNNVSLWFARVSLFFFFLSTAGPFSLGYLMANDLGGTVWYNFSIYYYLHFQYNGCFLFGIFGLFFLLLDQKTIGYDPIRIKKFGFWSAAACVPAYFLSVLFAKPGLGFNIVGGAAASVQLIALGWLFREMQTVRPLIKQRFSPVSYVVLRLAFAALVAKSILQLLSAYPTLAQLAWELRPVVIAYLHLVLVGIITLFLLAWYVEMGYARQTTARTAIWLLVAGFISSEICLVMLPWWKRRAANMLSPELLIFVLSLLLLAGTFAFFLATRKKLTKISEPLDNAQQG